MINYGFMPSVMDGTEYEFKENKEFRVPRKYSYVNYLPKVLDQGARPICVPCSISTYVNWELGNENGTLDRDYKVNLDEIFDCRYEKGEDGMTIKEALAFLRHNGVTTKKGNFKIKRYAKIGSEEQLKQALILNGPCVGALPVYEEGKVEFWDDSLGTRLKGGHAIAIVGYMKDGFIIRNSWGKSYGEKGYSILPYEDFHRFYEIWTIY